jgi:glutathione peroxidase
MSTLYDVPLATLSGAPTSLADYSGKVLLIVNVASKCGLTPQYSAFPSNDFAEQEPGSNQEIAKFCSTEYVITFPLFSKISVNGPEQHPIYTMLTSAMPQHEADGVDFRDNLDNYLSSQGLLPTLPLPAVLWNFEKFLVGKDGEAIARFAPDMKPDDPRIIAAIENALDA